MENLIWILFFGNVLKNDLIENSSNLEIEGIKTTKLASSKANKIAEKFIDSVGSSIYHILLYNSFTVYCIYNSELICNVNLYLVWSLMVYAVLSSILI